MLGQRWNGCDGSSMRCRSASMASRKGRSRYARWSSSPWWCVTRAYPITSWTFILVRESQTDALKARTLANLLWFMTHEGQASATSLHYAPLPSFLIDPMEAKIRLISGPDGRALSIDR
jgi:hypothetical protein